MRLVSKNCAEVWMGAIKENNDSNNLHPLVSKFFNIVEPESHINDHLRQNILPFFLAYKLFFLLLCLFPDFKKLINDAFLARNPKYPNISHLCSFNKL